MYSRGVRSILASFLDRARVNMARWLLRRRDGTWLHDEHCVSLVANDRRRERRSSLRQTSQRAPVGPRLVDPSACCSLTGLPNRALFTDLVSQALAQRDTPNEPVGVLFIDLDGFEGLNERLGHAFGDQVLDTAATRLVRCVRPSDTVARLGADEFGVLVDGLNSREDVGAVADRVASIFKDAFAFRGQKITVSATLGVALADPSGTAEDLLRSADLALAQAKSFGRAKTIVYDPELWRYYQGAAA